MTEPERRVVITGTAMTSPAGMTLEENSDAWWTGKRNFTTTDLDLGSMQAAPHVGHCGKIDVSILPDRKIQKAINRKDLIGVVTALGAAKHAGIKKGQLNPERMGMYVGSGCTQVGDLSDYFPLIEKSTQASGHNPRVFGAQLMNVVNPMVMLKTLMNNTLCYTSVALDIRGVNANFMDFQIAGLRAVGEARQAIVSGRADVIIAGGVSATPEPFHADDGIKIGYLARTDGHGRDPNEAVRPFDQDRSGTILSEGAAFLVLESEEHALSRGATILGELKSYHMAADGGLAYWTDQPARGLSKTLRQTCGTSGERDAVGFIVSHANGSVNGDLCEARAYRDFFGASVADIPVVSPKTVLGEMSEAAGVANIILAIEAIAKGAVPPTFNYQQGDAETSSLNVRAVSQKIKKATGLVTGRSFSGLACTVAIADPNL